MKKKNLSKQPLKLYEKNMEIIPKHSSEKHFAFYADLVMSTKKGSSAYKEKQRKTMSS